MFHPVHQGAAQVGRQTTLFGRAHRVAAAAAKSVATNCIMFFMLYIFKRIFTVSFLVLLRHQTAG